MDGIVEHRNGPDGDLGTGDDDIYDSLEELDAVDFVGPVTLDRLADWATELTARGFVIAPITALADQQKLQ